MFSCPSVGQIKLPNKVLLACEIDFLIVFCLVCLLEFLMCETDESKIGLVFASENKNGQCGPFSPVGGEGCLIITTDLV